MSNLEGVWSWALLWADTLPTSKLIALQWFYGFNHGRDVVTLSGGIDFRKLLFVKHNGEGFLNTCTF